MHSARRRQAEKKKTVVCLNGRAAVGFLAKQPHFLEASFQHFVTCHKYAFISRRHSDSKYVHKLMVCGALRASAKTS